LIDKELLENLKKITSSSKNSTNTNSTIEISKEDLEKLNKITDSKNIFLLIN